MIYEQDMRSFKGRSLHEQAKVMGLNPLIFMLIPLFVMIPFTVVKTIIVVIGIVTIVLSMRGLSFQECKRLVRKKFKRTRIVHSACPLNFQRNQSE